MRSQPYLSSLEGKPSHLKRQFLAMVGAVIDHNNMRMIFANVNKKISYLMLSTIKPQKASSSDEELMNPDIEKAKTG